MTQTPFAPLQAKGGALSCGRRMRLVRNAQEAEVASPFFDDVLAGASGVADAGEGVEVALVGVGEGVEEAA
ncbi:hypothetical protein JCM10369A_28680 [Nocardioides pyridinolyticus]